VLTTPLRREKSTPPRRRSRAKINHGESFVNGRGAPSPFEAALRAAPQDEGTFHGRPIALFMPRCSPRERRASKHARATSSARASATPS
jgi:hypothetical protein